MAGALVIFAFEISKVIRFLSLAIFLGVFLTFKGYSQTLCSEAVHVLKVLNDNHVSPRKNIDEKFISDLNEEFFSTLDPLGLYFTRENLKSDSVAIRASLFTKESPCDWAKFLKTFYLKKLKEANKTISVFLSKPLLFNEEDFISIRNFKQEDFCKDNIELKKRWKRWLSIKVLATMYEKAKSTLNVKIDSKLIVTFEPVARKEVMASELKRINDVIEDPKELDSDIRDIYIKSIAKIFDPHSDYFSTEEKQSFEEGISTTETSFGFDIKETTSQEVVVTRVMPGSPAWNSNEMHNGDLILQIRKPKGDFVDINDFDVRPSQLLKTWSADQIELKLKKADGQVVIVKLFKEKIESTENRVQGFVLTGQKKIGYVSLPSFYQQWDSDSKFASGCADDLAKEIIKLKKEGISGLILDLRYNGGGSVAEAIDIVGIFIDIGPVAVVKFKDRLITLKDANRGVVYDGPLIVMVNGASASASEFVAAALQDYNRAVVVGTTTFGKGTGQRIFATDTIKGEFLKITHERLYRITGKSNQRKGVVPDITVPDLTNEFTPKEKDYNHVIIEDSIVKKVYYTPGPKIDFSKMRLQSLSRTQKNTQFEKIDSARLLFRLPVPLKLESFVDYQSQIKHAQKLLETSLISSAFKVTHNQFDNSLLTMDSFRKNLSEESLTKISKSIFIEEAYFIISDYINQNRK
ncbi:MAG: S41 family peptidase [Cyclobacteriaceae bacterium]